MTRTPSSPASPTPTNDPAAAGLRLRPVRRGKVRDVYDLDSVAGGGGAASGAEGGRLLFVASDRVSAFDVVMPTPIPGKGRLLTEIAAWWFRFIEARGLAETHLISTDVDDIPAGAFAPGAAGEVAREWLRGRVTIGRRCRVVPVECVVRGYLEGSGWKDYQRTGAVCGVRLPGGLRQCERLPEPIFTPATKAAEGHDENITFEEAAEAVGLETIGAMREMSLAIYRAAAEHALARGIIIADTKFEFGIPADAEARAGRAWTRPMLIDEALTPDSSRFWPADEYEPGRPQRSYDKQYLREYLERLVAAGAWDKSPPGPALPEEVVQGTLERYRRARDLLCSPRS
jgi:phosphoribosylaminoimidazole-succinocarboxamide synthase